MISVMTGRTKYRGIVRAYKAASVRRARPREIENFRSENGQDGEERGCSNGARTHDEHG